MNYYGLSALNDQEYNLKLAFPYNELLWFIRLNQIGVLLFNQFPYNELLWFIALVYSNIHWQLGFPYNELLWFIGNGR